MRIITYLLLAFALTSSAVAAELPSSSTSTTSGTGVLMADLSREIMTFYQKPTEDSFLSIDDKISRVADKIDPTVAEMFIVFLAVASHEKKQPIAGTTPIHKQAHEYATSKWEELQIFILDDRAVTPHQIDYWWTSYFASGDSLYVDRVISTAIRPLPLKAEENDPAVKTIQTARWSLRSVAAQHPSVRSIISATIRQTNDPTLIAISKPQLPSSMEQVSAVDKSKVGDK